MTTQHHRIDTVAGLPPAGALPLQAARYAVPSFHCSHPEGGAVHRVSVAVQAGQFQSLPVPYPVPFGSSVSASYAGC